MSDDEDAEWAGGASGSGRSSGSFGFSGASGSSTPQRPQLLRAAKAVAATRIKDTADLTRQWNAEVLIAEMERAQVRHVAAVVKKRARDTAVCTCCVSEIGPGDAAPVQPCKADPSVFVCADCVLGMAKAMVSDVVHTGTPITAAGVCMLHHTKTTCGAYTLKGIVALLRSLADPAADALVDTVLQCARDSGHKRFAAANPCARCVACPTCGVRLSVGPGLGAYVAVHVCESPVLTSVCITCDRTVAVDAGTVATRREPVPGPCHADCVSDFCVVPTKFTTHRCRPMLPFGDMLRTLRRTGGGGSSRSGIVLAKGVCRPAATTRGDLQYFQWVRGAVRAQVMESLAGVDPEAEGRALVLMSDAVAMEEAVQACVAMAGQQMDVCRPYLDFVYAAAMKQTCPTCGKDGVKDDMCTHISCCRMWCYGCGKALQDKKAHVCEFGLHMEAGRGPDGTICASSPGAAVAMFHIAKLLHYMRHWLCCVGVPRGIVTLRSHEQLGPCWVEYGHLLFANDEALKRWVVALQRNVGPDRFQAMFGVDFRAPCAFVCGDPDMK